MKLTAITFGSRGDVEPFLALGRSLRDAGHQLRVLTHPEFAGAAAAAGVEFVGARGRSTRELIDSDEGRAGLRHAGHPIALLRRIADVLAPELRLIYEDAMAAVRDADAVLAFPATFPALDVAEHLGLPVVHVHHVPTVPTRAFPIPAPYIRARTLTGVGNRASYTVDAWLLWQLTHGAAGRARAAVLGSGARRYDLRRALAQRRRRAGAIVGVSPLVLRPPSDWPADAVMCGYWWPLPAAEPPAVTDDIHQFLSAGPAPVFFGLGSTPVSDPALVTRHVVEAARRSAVRLLLQRGWAGLGEGIAEPGIHIVGDIAYDEIFPRVAGVIHHGGAGTTALGLRHGRPTLCVPAITDQFFWAHRVAAIGAGPPPMPLTRLRPDRLAPRLAALAGEARYAQRAADLAAGLTREDAGTAAVAAIERFLGASRGTGPQESAHTRPRRWGQAQYPQV
jgi:sterol 3beta-glucosyltransferase